MRQGSQSFGLVEIDEGIELLRQAGFDIVRLVLVLAVVDHANGSLRSGWTKRVLEKIVAAENKKRAVQTQAVQARRVAAFQSWRQDELARRAIPLGSGGDGALEGQEAD